RISGSSPNSSHKEIVTIMATKLGHLALGEIPRVVGVVGQFDSTSLINSSEGFDVAEMRLREEDIESGVWKSQASAFRKLSVPVILTLRSQSEDGTWSCPESKRAEAFTSSLDLVSAIDVELSSSILTDTVAAAHEKNRIVIGSFHVFNATP